MTKTKYSVKSDCKIEPKILLYSKPLTTSVNKWQLQKSCWHESSSNIGAHKKLSESMAVRTKH